MIEHEVGVENPANPLPRQQQLAYQLARLASDHTEVPAEVIDMVINRIIDNAAVAMASLRRAPVAAARDQALAHPYEPGATVFGVTERVSPEWAAWANGVAVRELDFHDTFLAAEYSHPADNIAPVLAVAQHLATRRAIGGMDVVHALATAYEVHVNLVRAISLHEHKIDHVAHLAPAAVAGIGTLLGLATETTYQAIGQALHTTTATRQSRKGEISTWKAYAPAFAGKVAVEAVDRAMRGQTSPSPIYEGADGVIAWLLDGPEAHYRLTLPEPGEAKRAILETYTKEHSAEYQAQAIIDLARKVGAEHPEVRNPAEVADIVLHTSHHTHYVIGSGSGDPQKYEPTASRETLDHSIPYIIAVALQDGRWHHVDSYSPERAQRPDTVALWHMISTTHDPAWTRRYHATDPAEKAFGGRLEITLSNGTTISEEIAVADAHPQGARPFERPQYVEKFHTLTQDVCEGEESMRFLELVQQLPELGPDDLAGLTLKAPDGYLGEPSEGLF